jgi:hypothetical protein
VKVCFQPRQGTFNCNLLDLNDLSAKRRDCTSSQKNPDRLRHSATAKSRQRPASAQQRLVDVVMKNVAEPALVFATQIARQRLSQRITDGVRMAGSDA